MLERRVVVLSLLLACLLVLLIAAAAATAAGPQYAGGQSPSISQPLIREGDLAVQLTRAFGLGSSLDEVAAENQLAAVGIAPANGWIADYPVTPDIADEIRQAVSAAAASGKLNMDAESAVARVDSVLAQAGLDIEGEVAETGSESVEPPPSYPGTTVINNYYETEGPPVITYYAPPPAYTYLYGWVSYPFWCSGFRFPGFFVLHDFHRPVIIDRRPVFVSNHFHDARRDRFIRVDAATRFRGGDRTAVTTLPPGGSHSGTFSRGGRGGFSGAVSRDRTGHIQWRRDGGTGRNPALGVTTNTPAAPPAATVAPGLTRSEGRSMERSGRISGAAPGAATGRVSGPSRGSRIFGVSRSEAATLPSSGVVRGAGPSFRGGFSGSTPRSFSGSAPRSFSAPTGGGSHSIGSSGGFSRGSGSFGGRSGGGSPGGRGRR
jgi:hypothetical protein